MCDGLEGEYDTVRNGRQYKVQAPQRPVGTLSTATTGYDDTTYLTLPPTPQRLGGTGRQVAPDEYQPPAIAALRHATSTRQHGVMIARILITTTVNHTTSNTSALVRPRRSTDHHLRHQYIIDNGYSSTDADHTPARTIYNQPPPGPRQ
ncbi:Uncharacterized protein FWK35_00018175 [Aphis craccivora]|uniref:Uncharacterized protein n=1 Tax=Aphis craccivora TaxID=307492 RepID=A0A6G0Y767_APHCR|nr:Uncharacterized protein FWK35_00018175 [Aphis craccivora]